MFETKGNRLLIVLSDIEMAGGDHLDDFIHSDHLAKFIDSYNCDEYQKKEIDLVFNGDTFDFLKLPIDGEYPHFIDHTLAVKKLKKIYKAHQVFFESINRFVEYGARPRRVYFIVGNHDMELLFNEVQNLIIEYCGGSGQIMFPGFNLRIGDVYIEHGNQLDSLFQVNASNCFITHEGKTILNLPWTSVTLLNLMNPNHSYFHELDRIKPRDTVFKQIPKLKEYALGQLWNYWTKDYIKTNDPLKKVTWNMLKQAFKRSIIFNPDVEIEVKIFDQLKIQKDINIYIIGHLHDQKIATYGNKKLIQSGCFRDEFMVDETGEKFKLIPKNYIQIWLEKNKALVSESKEVFISDESQVKMPVPLHNYNKLLKDLLVKEPAHIDQDNYKELNN